VEHLWNNCFLCNSRKSSAKACAQQRMYICLCNGLRWILWVHCLKLSGETDIILVVGDYFTKWKEAFAIRDMEAVTVARCVVNEVIC
jgi:hypothetical protein